MTSARDELVRLTLAGVNPRSARLLADGLQAGALVRGDDERAYWRARYHRADPSPEAREDRNAGERVRQARARATAGPRGPRPSERITP